MTMASAEEAVEVANATAGVDRAVVSEAADLLGSAEHTFELDIERALARDSTTQLIL